jgi:ATP-dependent DNA helicase RecQ
MDHALSALKKYFGYDAFRLTQSEVIQRTLNNQSSLVIMPTGGGKSICYQLPAVLLEGLTIVVSPLIALMQDQVSALQANGISAEAMNSACTSEQESVIKQRAVSGELKLLYVSPERAVSWEFLQWVGGIRVAQIAIDEAHCVSIWGNDFRPEYTRLTELISVFPNVPVAALTATADTATQQDIRQRLQLRDCAVFVSSFERKNIETDVLPAKKRIQIIQKFLEARPNHAGIVYCLSRRSTEETAAKLRQAGYKAAHYHGAMKSEDRTRVQDQFLRDEIQIVCATIAFGMGIDKPNIRWVIHYNLPKNIESYYQEIGRAGRDGEYAQALLFAGYGDMKTLTGFVEDSNADPAFKQVQLAKLSRMWEFTQTLSCRTNFVLNYFGEYREQKCGHCDRCLNPPKTFDGTIIAQKALSACVRLRRLGHSVGINMLIDVLRGSSGRELMANGYHEIETYGAGKDISWKDWSHYITQLIDRGYLAIDFTQGNVLHRTTLSDEVLKGITSVMLCEQQELILEEKTLKPADLSHEENVLFEALKELRRSIAEDNNSQAYTVFSDASLKDMARLKPGNLAAFLKVSGVGEHKKEKYGAEFIALICSLVAEEERLIANESPLLLSASSKTISKVKKENKTGKKSDFLIPKVGDTHRQTLELYDEGLSIKEISEERNLKPMTIKAHLFRLAFHGEQIDLSTLITDEKISEIQQFWVSIGQPDSLRQVYEAAEERFDWEKIRYAVCLMKREEQ